MSLWNKIKYLNLNIFRTRCCKPLIFQTQIIWSNRINSLKYLRSATFGSKDIVIRKSEFVEESIPFPSYHMVYRKFQKKLNSHGNGSQEKYQPQKGGLSPRSHPLKSVCQSLCATVQYCGKNINFRFFISKFILHIKKSRI